MTESIESRDDRPRRRPGRPPRPRIAGLGERLRQARKAKGLRQYEAALIVGVRAATLCIWEREYAGVLPPQARLPRLAEVLGVTVGWLLGTETPTATAADQGDEQAREARAA